MQLLAGLHVVIAQVQGSSIVFMSFGIFRQWRPVLWYLGPWDFGLQGFDVVFRQGSGLGSLEFCLYLEFSVSSHPPAASLL